MRILIMVALSAACFLAPDAFSVEHTDREIARVYAEYHLRHDQTQSAIAILQDHLTVDPEDGGAWNLMGLCYIDLGKPIDAENALKSAIKYSRGKEQAIAYYNLASVIVMNKEGFRNNQHSIRDMLGRIAHYPAYKKTSDYAIANLKAGVPLPPLWEETPVQVHAQVGLRAGYDTNVLLLSSETISASGATGTSSPLYGPTLSLNAVKDLRNKVFTSTLASSFTGYVQNQAMSYNSASGAFNMDWEEKKDPEKRWTDGYGADANVSLLNTGGMKLYNWSVLPQYRMEFTHNEEMSSQVVAKAGYSNYAVSAGIGDYARSAYLGGLTLKHFRTYHLLELEGSLGAERAMAKGKEYKTQTYLASAKATFVRIFTGMNLSTTLMFDLIDYYKSSNARTDQKISGEFEFSGKFTPSLTWSGTYSPTLNQSSVDTSTYTKHMAVIHVSYHLF